MAAIEMNPDKALVVVSDCGKIEQAAAAFAVEGIG